MEEMKILENGTHILENMLEEILEDWQLTSPQWLQWLRWLQLQSILCVSGVREWANKIIIHIRFLSDQGTGVQLNLDIHPLNA